MTQPIFTPERVDSEHDELFHLLCKCQVPRTPHFALCGLNVTDRQWTDGEGELACAVCDDLDGFPCERCGEP